MSDFESIRHHRRRAAIVCAIALLAAFGSWEMVANRVGTTGSDTAAAQAAFEEATGVRIVGVTVTAGGGMLDLRYRVLDPDKAIVVHDKDNPPTIVHEATNYSINKPFMHHSKGRDLHAAITYYELLLNQGEVVKPGDAVTIVIGDTRLAHIIAQ